MFIASKKWQRKAKVCDNKGRQHPLRSSNIKASDNNCTMLKSSPRKKKKGVATT